MAALPTDFSIATHVGAYEADLGNDLLAHGGKKCLKAEKDWRS
jgi:hypothetical protein